MPFEYFFPQCFFYRDDLVSESDNHGFLEAALALRKEFPSSSRSNIYTTYGSLNSVLDRPEFEPLRDSIVDCAQIYLRQVETPETYGFRIDNSWMSLSSPGNYERMHIHGGSYVSGVYYLDSSENSGRIIFENLDDNRYASLRTRSENFNAVSYEPKPRRLILFNSQIPHHVTQNRSRGMRVVISFNIVLESRSS